MTKYSPSPRPTFDRPVRIDRAFVTRHIWGDGEAGEVADWIYVSSDNIHLLEFGLAPGGAFTHSEEFRTIFGADELLYVLEGTMVLANPETGEVLRVPQGQSAYFRKDTWHHAFAHGGGPCRVLEFFSPPPSTGASGAYARTKPYLKESRYRDDSLIGCWPAGSRKRTTLQLVDERETLWTRDLGVLVGLYFSTEHLHAGVVEVNPGERSARHVHSGDEVLYSLSGALHVRAVHAGETTVLELAPGDVAYLPAGCEHEYACFGSELARALLGVAPGLLP